jgi:hypothetical protein
MMKQIFLLCMLITSIPLFAQDYDTHLKDTRKVGGFFDFYVQDTKGKIYVEVQNLGEEFLYYSSLARGIGSNDIGQDRGKIGKGKVVRFIKSGNKLLLIEPNYAYRATAKDTLEQQAVTESFASSVLFGFEILARKDGKFLIDFTPFLLRDADGTAQSISATRQGTYSFDASRSGLFLEMCKSFPLNTEFEAIITLTGTGAGPYLRSVVPTVQHVTVHQHHSFVKLPEPGFKTRELDPRIGYFGTDYFDYSSPIDVPIAQKLIARHRLEKKYPNQAVSEPVKPIVYYLDAGVPEPIRSALFEGATWWNEAFEAAGFKDAFQVKMLPADADPMDIRYNLIQWVHRSTRGWSYGASITDPRTGEILKGKVSLGSLRVRQDYLIAQGLTADFDSGKEQPHLLKMALDRLKQLSAHEIGHTLGLPHNYVASVAARASVMDYPHPTIKITDGKIDLSDAYAMGIGEFDKMAIRWGYQEFTKGTDEKKALNDLANDLLKAGYRFLSDQDARADGSVHPETHLWDNGGSATEELKHIMAVRKLALKGFGKARIPAGTPYANLEEVLVPVYMLHRFQTQAAAKTLGGAYYHFGLKGDALPVFTPASAKEQNAALEALMSTLDPEFLGLSPELLTLIPPRAYRFGASARETFRRRTGMTFDPLGPAEASAQLTLSLLLNAERASRLASQQVYDASLPSLNSVLTKMTQTLWKSAGLGAADYKGQIRRVTALMYLTELMNLSLSKSASIEAKVAAAAAVAEIKALTKTGAGWNSWVQELIRNFETNPKEFEAASFHIAPDGQPIDQDYDWLGIDCEHEH